MSEVRSTMDNQSAVHHLQDMKRIRLLEEFDSFKKEGLCKPIIIFMVEGGPEENPRLQKIIR